VSGSVESSVSVRWDDRLVEVTLNRPDKLNALNPDIFRALIEIQDEVARRPDVHVMLLRGAGRVFSAGADLEYIASIYRDPEASRENLHLLRDAVLGLERLPIPVVAAVHGVALAGGLELAMGCDIIVAAASARIGDQHINFGFVPGGGSTQRLPRWVGNAHARDLILTGRWITASEAREIGLVARVLPDEDFQSEALDFARDLSNRSRDALTRSKTLLRHASDGELAPALDLEIDTVLDFYDSPAFAESLQSFINRKDAR
jgi:enoyl-CoA hydratase/carnithine racemase